MLTGTDEHGTHIAEAAAAAGMDPQAFCDNIVKHFEKAWKDLIIDNNDFIRTTQARHIAAFQKFISILKKAKTDSGEDVIYSGEYEGLYCTGCEKFLTEKELVDGLCPDHKRPPERVKEKNYFFRLTAYLDKLRGLIESNELLILPDERRREVLGLFEQGLSDFSASREKVKWGIPLPFDESQNAYVWIEALTNYITAIGYGADEGLFKKWWYEAEKVHFMAKEILKFHCIFWPAMLMAAKLPLPEKIFLHGFFTIDGQKMSKSLGNQIPPGELVEQFGADATRYLIMTQYPFGADGDIQRSRFTTKYNSDLANDLGNLVSRVARMIMASFEGKLPAPYDGLEAQEELVSSIESLPESVIDHVNNLRITSAIDDTMALVRMTNKFFDTNAPWKLLKEGGKERAGGVLYACSEAIRVVATLLQPLMPNKALEILSVYGLDETALSTDNARIFFYLKPGTAVVLRESIFPRLKERGRAEISKEDKKMPENVIDINEFARGELVVAKVLEASRVEGTDKLMKLQINIGSETRQIVAGIAEYYTAEEMVGKAIVVVKNLAPAKVRGVESRGMLLAAHNDKNLVLIVPDGEIPPGTSIS